MASWTDSPLAEVVDLHAIAPPLALIEAARRRHPSRSPARRAASASWARPAAVGEGPETARPVFGPTHPLARSTAATAARVGHAPDDRAKPRGRANPNQHRRRR